MCSAVRVRMLLSGTTWSRPVTAGTGAWVAGGAAGDAGAVVNALVNAPAHLVGGVLNGAGSILGGLLPAAGILTPYDPNFGFLASGPISSLIALRETIAQALGAAPPARSTVQVGALPGGFLVEIEVTAARKY